MQECDAKVIFLNIKMDFNSLLYEDNLGMISLIKDPVHQKWSKTNIAVCIPATQINMMKLHFGRQNAKTGKTPTTNHANMPASGFG